MCVSQAAKNIILAGVRSVTLYDPTPVTLADLSSQFYLEESQVGEPRAATCVSKLRELNEYVTVDLLKGELTPDAVKDFSCAVFVNASEETLREYGDACHAAGTHFVATGAYGLMGYSFSDFGEGFTVLDANGENPKGGLVISISNDNPGVVSVGEGERHGLGDGDHVLFERCEGMPEVADGKPREIKVVGPDSFSIEDTTGYGTYTRGGYWQEVKRPQKLDFKPFAESLDAEDPGTNVNVLLMERPLNIRALLKGLWAFQRKHGGALPTPGNRDEGHEVIEASGLDVKREDAEYDVLLRLACTSAGNLSPLAAVFGGVVGQEVMKACTGKFTPIQQWFLYDWGEALKDIPSPADLAPRGCRYDGQIAVFGVDIQKQLEATNIFVVGAGALGCEFLKSFALMGVSCGEGASLRVTDMDRIEKSNLNRQFLFRAKDVGAMKSTTAAAAARAMNPALRVEALTDKMAPETESKYDDVFWENIGVVCNALDNVQARLYMDSRCVQYQVPLLESGTLGTKGNNLTCLPRVSESYASQPDPPDESIPACTLKSFPNLIEHTLQWARDAFELYFHNNAAEVNSYLTKPDYMSYLDKQRNAKVERLRTLAECLGDAAPRSFKDCVHWARTRFEMMFNHNIRDLLHQYPLDFESDGQPFWTAKKRPPTPLEFDLADDLHAQFLISAASLHARMYGVEGETKDLAAYAAALEDYSAPEWTPATEKIPENEEEAKKMSEAKEKELAEGGAGGDLDDLAAGLLKRIPPVESLSGFRVSVAEFEKDDDSNGHMDFITATGNLRARQYNIPEADSLKAKQIVGRIIPAIATTTAITTGLVSLELLKLIGGLEMEAFRNHNFNLAINMFAGFEPMPAPKKTFAGQDYNLWTTIDIDGDLTVEELNEHFEDTYGMTITGLMAGGVVLYDGMDDEDRKVTELYQEAAKSTIRETQNQLLLGVLVEDPDADDMDAEIDAPPIRLKFREG